MSPKLAMFFKRPNSFAKLSPASPRFSVKMYHATLITYSIVKPFIENVSHFLDRQIRGIHSRLSLGYSVVNYGVHIRSKCLASRPYSDIINYRKRSVLCAFNSRTNTFHCLVIIRHCSEVILRLKLVYIEKVRAKLPRLLAAL